MTNTTLTTIGIVGQVVPLLCMLSIPVLNWMERRNGKKQKLIKDFEEIRNIISFQYPTETGFISNKQSTVYKPNK